MGFFSDLKNDLTQAVTEMTDEKAKAEMMAEEERLKSELSAVQPEPESDLISILEEVEELTEIEEEAQMTEPQMTEPVADTIPYEQMFAYGKEMNVTEGSLEISGKIAGNLTIPGSLCLSGEMNGRIQAQEVILRGAKVVGDIICSKGIEVDADSVVIGNIIGTAAVISGALKGDVDVDGLVILESTAIVKGNMKTGTVQMNNGAVIEGMFSQCYAQVSPSTFFDDMK